MGFNSTLVGLFRAEEEEKGKSGQENIIMQEKSRRTLVAHWRVANGTWTTFLTSVCHLHPNGFPRAFIGPHKRAEKWSTITWKYSIWNSHV